MKNRAMAFLVACAALCAFSLSACSGLLAQAPGAATVGPATVEPVPASRAAYEPGELIVRGDASIADAVERAGFPLVDVLAQPADGDAVLLVRSGDNGLAVGDDLAAAAQSLAEVAGVAHVQPNYRLSSQAAADVVRDEDVAEQHYLDSWKESYGANVVAAWDKVNTTDKVSVAVLDTGTYVMPEYSRSGELQPASADDLHQEFDADNLDLEHAADFVHTPADEASPVPLVNEGNPYGDDNGHGTHVSAIIAAHAQTDRTPNNLAVGMAGVSPNARIVPVKVLDAGGEGTTANFIKAYNYLMNVSIENLRVINMSLSITFDEGSAPGEQVYTGESEVPTDGDVELKDDPTSTATNEELHNVIHVAEERGIVTVCAAGNEANSAITFPSDYEECISVVALDGEGHTAAFSNVNMAKDISAPGTDIYSAWGSQADAYVKLSGTSQATAIVSGVLSLLWAAHPDLSIDDVRNAIINTAQYVDDPDAVGSQYVSPAASSGAGTGTATAATASTGAATVATDTASSALAAGSMAPVANGSAGAIDAARALAWIDDPDGDDNGDDNGDNNNGGKTPPGGGDSQPPVTPGDSTNPGNSDDPNPNGDAPEPGDTDAPADNPDNPDNPENPADTGGDADSPQDPTPSAAIDGNGDLILDFGDDDGDDDPAVDSGKAPAADSGSGSSDANGTPTASATPPTTKIAKAKAGKRSFTVTWKKRSGVSGYQVRYGTHKNMKSTKKKLVKASAKKLKVGKLKSGKRYYVQVRTYKKANGKKTYSKWSAKKSVKVK